MTYKDQVEILEDELGDLKRELKIRLDAKEQVISCLYNLLKDIVFWKKN